MSFKDKIDQLLSSYVAEAKYAKATPKDDDGKGLDKPGHEDGDIDNDGDKDKANSYLKNRRKVITKAIEKQKSMDEMFEEMFKDKIEEGRGRPRKVRAPGEEEKERPGSTKTYRAKFIDDNRVTVRDYEGTSELDAYSKAQVDAKRMKMRIDSMRLKEEVEELDELSKSTLASYAKKATRDARMKMATGKDFERIATSSRKPASKKAAATWERRYKGDARKREAGVEKAIDRLAKEEIELQEGYEKVVLDFLDKHGINAYFRSGKLVVDKKDAQNAKKALAKANDFDSKDLEIITESNDTAYRWGDINNALMSIGMKAPTILKVLAALRGKAIK